tara:strand:+ start:4731 stop:5036 length:306 start_codon:yes stop_codon:yes gene_type:complete
MGDVSLMDPLFSSALELMLVGMGSVFFFLTLLVLAMLLMSRLVGLMVPVGQQSSTGNTRPGDVIPAAHVAAISAAIAMHRRGSGDGHGSRTTETSGPGDRV